MAQKYNPTTGQWEEEDEENSLTGGATAAFGVGSSPSMPGTSMAPSFGDPGFFRQPQLPSGYGWGDEDYLTSQGITKKYANPWDTKYSYMKGEQDLGFGYDDYQTAISKLAFNSGKLQIPELAATEGLNEYGMPAAGSPGAPGGWTHNAYYTPANSGYGVDGYFSSPEQRGPTFATEQELFDYMLKDSSRGLPLTMESREKYGRPLLSGQLQNTYAMLANPNGVSGFTEVPDWNYHRTPYAGGSYSLSGDAAMVGTDPFFGPDGKVLGYRFNNPDHYNLVDNSGRVTSAGVGSTSLSPEVQNLLRGIDDKSAFINASDSSKFGYGSSSVASYNKADSSFESFLKTAAPIALAMFAMPQLSAMFSGVGAAGAGLGEAALGSGLTAEGGGLAAMLGETAGLGFTPAAGLNFTPLSSLGSMAEIGAGFGGAGLSSGLGALEGLGGLGLEGLPGMVSDLGSLFGETLGQGFTPASGLEFSPTSSIGAQGIGAGQGGLGFASELGVGMDLGSTFVPAAEALTPSPEYQVPDSYSPLDGVDPFSTTEEVNKGFNKLTGYGMNDPYGKGISGLPLGTEGEIKNMYNFMTQSPGKAGMFKAPSPLEMLYKGGKGIMDYRSNQDAMKMYKDQLDKVSSYSDPNRARGDTANQLWQQNFQDPMAGYRDFMMGGGRDFIDQARAQAAKSGKRGSYINSGKMNSDLASMYMKQQLARGDSLTRGFANSPNNAENTMKYMAPMVDMERNKYAPFGQAIDSIMRGFQLSDLFGG